jgi:hypothetical protein
MSIEPNSARMFLAPVERNVGLSVSLLTERRGPQKVGAINISPPLGRLVTQTVSLRPFVTITSSNFANRAN